MRAMKQALFSGVLTAVLTTSVPVAAQDAGESTNRVATKTDWSVFVEEGKCWGVSAPKEAVTTRDGRVVAARRGDILIWVTYDPSESVSGEVSFTGGYPFADGSTVTLQIGDSTFELFTQGEHAWPPTPGDDQKIITSMKRGTDAIVTGRSSRGAVTKDTFSLLGFTAALEEAERRCAS